MIVFRNYGIIVLERLGNMKKYLRITPEGTKDFLFAECAAMDDVCGRIRDFFRSRTEQCVSDGIDKDYICLDPGVGFGKSYRQNLAIAQGFGSLCLDGFPMLAAASRKRVIGMSCGNPPADRRMPGTVAYHTICIWGGAHMIRVHDIPEAVQGARVADAVMRGGALPTEK